MKIKIGIFILCCGIACAAGAQAKLEVPRFVSLKNDEVNMRTGPGERFPIDWVYTEKNYPVEVIDEFEFWRQIREYDGTTGWVHRTMLSSNRYALVSEDANLYAKPTPASRIIGNIMPQVLGKIVRCPERLEFCLVDFGTVKGWMAKNNFWGIYPREIID